MTVRISDDTSEIRASEVMPAVVRLLHVIEEESGRKMTVSWAEWDDGRIEVSFRPAKDADAGVS